MRIIVFGGLYWGPPILGNFHVWFPLTTMQEKRRRNREACLARKASVRANGILA